jgi:hypothetical protein
MIPIDLDNYLPSTEARVLETLPFLPYNFHY